MKKMLFTLLLTVMCQLGFGQSATAVFNDFKSEKKAEYVHIGKAMMAFASGQLPVHGMSGLMNKLNSASTLSLNHCRKSVRRKFAARIDKLAGDGYEEYVRFREGRKDILMMVKPEGDYLSEVVVLVTDKNDCLAVLGKGRLEKSDLEKIAGEIKDEEEE
jgi:hypothetical protein